MVSFRDFKDDYEHNWAGLHIRKERAEEVRKEADRLLKGKAAYQKVEAKTGGPGIYNDVVEGSNIPLNAQPSSPNPAARFDPIAFALKRIGWQRQPPALLARVESVPAHADTGQPEPAQRGQDGLHVGQRPGQLFE